MSLGVLSPLPTASHCSSDGGSYLKTNSVGLLEGESVGGLEGILVGGSVVVTFVALFGAGGTTVGEDLGAERAK